MRNVTKSIEIKIRLNSNLIERFVKTRTIGLGVVGGFENRPPRTEAQLKY